MVTDEKQDSDKTPVKQGFDSLGRFGQKWQLRLFIMRVCYAQIPRFYW